MSPSDKTKVYWCLTQQNRRVIIRARSKKDAEAASGVPQALWAVYDDGLAAIDAKEFAQVYGPCGLERYERSTSPRGTEQ